MTDVNLLWFTVRGAGIVSMLLFTAVMLLGLMTSGRWQAREWPRFVTTDLHRNVSLLSLIFLGIHIVTAIVDPYTALGPLAALVPFAVDYKRLWLGLGAIAFDLTLALIITSLIRGRIGVRTWRTIHWASYLAWPVAMLHGLGTGTDATTLWMQALVIVCVALVAGMVAWRALAEPPAFRTDARSVSPPAGRRPPFPALSATAAAADASALQRAYASAPQRAYASAPQRAYASAPQRAYAQLPASPPSPPSPPRTPPASASIRTPGMGPRG